MPRINKRLSWAAGVGGNVPMLVDDREVRGIPSPVADWLTYDGDEVVSFTWGGDDDPTPGPAPNYRIIAVNAVTKATRVLHRGEYNKVVAGGGHWGGQHISGQWQVDGVPTPLVDPRDPQLGNLPVIGFGRDGSIATAANHFAGLVVNGVLWSSEVVVNVTIIDAQTGIWQSATGVHTKGMPVPQLLPGAANHLRIARVNDGKKTAWWPLYLAAEFNGQLVTHPPDSFLGYAFTQPGAHCDRPDIGSDGQWQLCVVWGTAESESVGQIGIARTNIMRDPRILLNKPVVPPVDPPIPPIEPPVEPPVMDYLAINERVRAKYPRSNPGGHPLGADHCWYLVDLAQQTGTLLFEKNGGDNVFIPQVNKNVSLDIVGRGSMGNTYADCLGDAEGEANPVWQVKSPANGTYIDVSGVVLPGGPVDPPDPPVGDCPARVRQLEDAIRELRDSANEMIAMCDQALKP